MLLQGKIASGTFENRVVLIGQSSDAARDSDFTPLYRLPKVDGSRLRMGGTQIHAAAVRSLLEGSAVRRVPKLTLWTVTLVLSWLTAWLTLRKQLYLSVFGTLLPIALTMIGSALLYRYDRIWLPMLVPCCSMALTLPLGIAVSFLDERVLRAEAAKQREQIMTLFSRYVDPQVASRVWKNRDQLSLEGEERVATVMFSDIRNFTALSAAKPPAVVLKWLNEYMTAMDEVIRRHDGFLNKYIGDGIMIIFGVPLSKGQQDDARRAVKSAIAMLERVEQLNARHLHDRDFPCISIGIGIHTGPLIAGSIGSQFRLEYSVLGETVNLASRLESCNKEYGTQILMSHATYETVRDQFDGLISLGETKIKGFDDPVQIYTLSATGLAPDHPSAQTHPARVEV
jgi:adenylate cyclase